MRCYVVSLSEKFPTFVKTVLPSSSGSSNGLLDRNDEGSMTLRNIGKYSPKDTASYCARLQPPVGYGCCKRNSCCCKTHTKYKYILWAEDSLVMLKQLADTGTSSKPNG